MDTMTYFFIDRHVSYKYMFYVMQKFLLGIANIVCSAESNNSSYVDGH